MSLKWKILLAYVLLLTVTLSMVATFNYISNVRILEGKALQQLGIAGNVINEQFDNYFKDIDVISGDIAMNEQIQKSLQRNYVENLEYEYRNLNEANQIAKYFQGISTRKPGILSIMVYANNRQRFYYCSNYSWDLDYDNSSEAWFADTFKADGAWLLSGKRIEKQLLPVGAEKNPEVITFSRLIKETSGFQPVGLLQINISLEYLKKIGLQAVREGSVTILDKNGDVISGSNIKENREFLNIEKTSFFSGWKIVYHAPRNDLLKETKQVRDYIIVFTLVSIIVAVIIARLIIWGITRPLGRLKERMKLASEGDFESYIPYKKKDEMGELISGFNHMTSKIKSLIDEIKEKEQQRLETELDSLQARINPHFMYNTLNSIRWISMMEGNEKMTGLLTSFVYLLKFASKNKGTFIPIRDEISILKAYADLMKPRYENFKVEVQCSNHLNKSLTVPFILQPLVENSIVHGVAPSGRAGHIEVNIYQQEESIVAVVSDNGVGMDENAVEGILRGEVDENKVFSSIGIKNVHDRLKIHFGDKAMMKLESEIGKGARIELRWPVMMGGEYHDEGHDS